MVLVLLLMALEAFAHVGAMQDHRLAAVVTSGAFSKTGVCLRRDAEVFGRDADGRILHVPYQQSRMRLP